MTRRWDRHCCPSVYAFVASTTLRCPRAKSNWFTRVLTATQAYPDGVSCLPNFRIARRNSIRKPEQLTINPLRNRADVDCGVTALRRNDSNYLILTYCSWDHPPPSSRRFLIISLSLIITVVDITRCFFFFFVLSAFLSGPLRTPSSRGCLVAYFDSSTHTEGRMHFR